MGSPGLEACAASSAWPYVKICTGCKQQAGLLSQDVIQKETGSVQLDINAAVGSPACTGFLLESEIFPDISAAYMSEWTSQ